MHHVAHSDWMFDHSLGHHANTSTDPSTDTSEVTQPIQTNAAASSANALWHHTDGGSTSSTQGSSGSSASSNASSSTASPTLTVTNNALNNGLTVNAGGSVSLPISVSPANGHTSVTIAGLTNYETVTDTLDGKTFTPDANGSLTLSAAEVNSGISLASNYTGTDHPVNTLTITAADTFGHHTVTSAAQTITVTDPPASTAGSGSSTSSSGTNTLSLQVSGDQYNGDPQIEVFVDGQQMGGTYTVTADHASGQTQTVTITGNFDPSVAHQVQVEFVNDASDGTSWWSNGSSADGHDRNVYVESISLNGQTLNGSQGTDAATNGIVPAANTNEAVMDVNGTLTFNVPDPPATTSTATSGTSGTSATAGTTTSSSSDTLTLQVSGDQYNGDPQIAVSVDGQQVGTYTVTADHASGQAQTITITGNFDPSAAHEVQVQFTNDAWDGTSWWSNGSSADGHDRNVYVESISLNGQTLNGSQGTDAASNGVVAAANPNEAVMDVNGTLTFNVPDPPASTSTATTGASSSGSSVSSTSGSGTSATGAGGATEVGTGAGQVPSGDGFYVSPTGSDGNPGTLAAPFATLARAQQAMESSSIKTTYVEGGTYNMSSTLTLTPADSGETWAYYAPNGVDSAVLDGGGTLSPIIELTAGTSNVTINGLTLQHFGAFGIDANGGGGATIANLTIENCDIGFGGVGVQNGTSAGIGTGNAPDLQILHNYIHDLQGDGVAVYAFNSGDTISGTVINSNVVLRTNQSQFDSGAIYLENPLSNPTPTQVQITNNFISDYGGTSGVGGMNGIYLDQDANNVLIQGNIIGPPQVGASNAGNYGGGAAVLVNSGNHVVVTDNIIDLGSQPYTFVEVIGGSDPGNASSGGDTFTNNVVLSEYTGNFLGNMSGVTGVAFEEGVGNQFNASEFTIANNAYLNTAGGQVLTNGNVAGDSSPQSYTAAQMGISGSLYNVASSSALYGSPVNFTPIVGGWGPAGFVIPQG